MRLPNNPCLLSSLFLILLPVSILANDILETDGFQSCLNDSAIQVQKMNIQFDRSTNTVHFDVAGSSASKQNVTANLVVSAYGKQVYQKSFDPCAQEIHVQDLCPVPEGSFAATGHYSVPAQYASQIPAIAYNIPDLDGTGKIELQGADGKDVACVQSGVTNSKSLSLHSVSFAAAGIAGAALVVSGLGAIAGAVGGAHSGGSTSSPTFVEVITCFQGFAMNGMLDVNYPSVYRSFSSNFGFSTGLFPWDGLQNSIDNFRARTGGNLTDDSLQYLQSTTAVYQTSSSSSGQTVSRRSIPAAVFEQSYLALRQINTDVDGNKTTVGTGATNGTDAAPPSQRYVSGIEAYVGQLMVPKSNTFMTILLIFAIILAAITAGILLFKVILETWALMGRFPKKLVSFRKNYWWLLAKTITNLILLLYGVWTLYCVYQWTEGDSWAAKLLAGVTFAVFTAVLIGFTWRIHVLASKSKKLEGDNSLLYEDKDVWRKYSIFYDNYKRNYWWIFVPTIIFMFARGVIIAGAHNHGLAQAAGQLIVDSLLLILLIFLRPYNLKSGSWINITIQVVRVISIVCILTFCEELGIAQTTKTVIGFVLVVVQAVLTAILAILIAVNAIINCVKMNPHRKQRKEAGKSNKCISNTPALITNLEKFKEQDDLTPLDAHNSLLMYPMDKKNPDGTAEMVSIDSRGRNAGYDMLPLRDESTDRLVPTGAAMGLSHDRQRSMSPMSIHSRQPQLPDLNFQRDTSYKGTPGMAL